MTAKFGSGYIFSISAIVQMSLERSYFLGQAGEKNLLSLIVKAEVFS